MTLGVILDETRDDDIRIEENSLTFIVDRALVFILGQDFAVDLDARGAFRVSVPAPDGAGAAPGFSFRPR